MAVSLKLNVSQNIWRLDQNTLHAVVRRWASPPDLFIYFFPVSRLPQNLMLECLISLAFPDPCMTMSEWRYSRGVVKVFCSCQCWLCLSTNTYSVMRNND